MSNIQKDIDAHLSWMQAIIGDGAPAGKAGKDAYASQVDDLIASIQEPAGQRQAKVSDAYEQYSALAKDAYNASNPSPLVADPQPSSKQYRISDPCNSSDESDCEDYYVDDAAQIRGQEIPDWARADALRQQLEKQQTVDPDNIFTGFDKTCDLSSMFEKKKRKFKIRGDSGWWAVDGVTPAEEVNYKKAVGLA